MPSADTHHEPSPTTVEFALRAANEARAAHARGDGVALGEAISDVSMARQRTMRRGGTEALADLDAQIGQVPGLEITTPGAITASPTLRTTLSDAAMTAAGALWLGATAARHGMIDEVLELVPLAQQQQFEAGATACMEAGGNARAFPRPASVDTNSARRISSYLASAGKRRHGTASGTEPAEEVPWDVGIKRLVRRPSLGRAAICLTVSCAGQEATLEHLTGTELLSYAAIRARAAEQGLFLPALPRSRKGLWDDLLAIAVPMGSVETPDDEDTTELAILAECRRIIESAEQPTEAGAAQDLRRGLCVVLDRHACVMPHALVRRVRAALRDDTPDRGRIADACKQLGRSHYRPRFDDTDERPRVWRFPLNKDHHALRDTDTLL